MRGTASEQVVIDAPAKINLYLEILGRRADGFHEIDTVMQTVSFGDTLKLRARSDDSFKLALCGQADGVPTDGTNLVIRAAEALAERLCGQGDHASIHGADIELEKRIPPGAGLGGGSSDAAATLVGLRRLWDSHAPDALLAEVAAGLGSDIPFFIRNGTARCRGRGEIVEPLEAEGAMHAVLVFGDPLNTANVYKVFAESHLTRIHAAGTLPWCESGVVRLGDLGDDPLRNALEPAAFQIRPELREVKESLVRAGATQACMSGSGSCVYGIVESEEHAGIVASAMAASGRRCAAVRSVGPRC
jgi:4-diphosphocytidyl-2-C-methyl-D-erythritol kinase